MSTSSASNTVFGFLVNHRLYRLVNVENAESNWNMNTRKNIDFLDAVRAKFIYKPFSYGFFQFHSPPGDT